MPITRNTLEALQNQKQAIANVLDQHQKKLAAAWINAWNTIHTDLVNNIEEAISQGLDNIADHDTIILEIRAQQHALNMIETTLNQVDNTAINTTAAVTRTLVEQSTLDQLALIETQYPANQSPVFTYLNQETLETVITRSTQQITARHYYLTSEAQKTVAATLARNIPAGINPLDTAQRIINDCATIFNGGLTRAINIARTETLDAYRNAAMLTQNQNRDILAGWQWQCTLSERSCISCIAMHGTIHSLDEPGPLDHQQGRCARVPIVKSWRELGFTSVKEPASALNEGDGLAWFNTLNEDEQKTIMGKNKWEAWQAGGFPSEQWARRRTTDGWRDSYIPGTP